MIWQPEHDEELQGLFDADLSHGHIADQMSYKFKILIGRNAVIGRCHRLGLIEARRPSPIKGGINTRKRRGIARKSAQPKAAPKPRIRKPRLAETIDIPALRCVEVVPRNIPLLDLQQHECRYPYGDGPFVFCGHPAMEGSPYCMPHLALCTGLGTRSEREAGHASG